MIKRAHHYRITLEHLSGSKPEDAMHDSLTFECTNHDDIFSIIEKLRQKDPFNDKEQATEFALGLKLFSEVMLKNRQHPLFEDFSEAFRSFMQKVKSQA